MKMRNLFVLTLVLLCVVVPAYASDTDTSETAATDAAPEMGAGVTIGGHDAFLPEASALYKTQEGKVNVVRNVVNWGNKDGQLMLGLLSGVSADTGVSMNIAHKATAVSRGLGLETGLRTGMNFDVWGDGFIVWVPHMGLHIKTLLSNPTTLYATAALGLATDVSSASQTVTRPLRFYSFAGIKQEVGPFGLDVAVGNHNTVRASIMVKGIRLFGAKSTINPGIELLRSSGRDSVVFFVKLGSF